MAAPLSVLALAFSLTALAVPSAQALGLLPAYEAALVNDPVYRAAVHERDAGQQQRILGRAHLLPTLSAVYSRNKNSADITTSVPNLPERTEHRDYTSLSSAVQLRQPLYSPEGSARYRQGIVQTNASEAQFQAQTQQLIVRLVSVYAPAQYAEDQLSLAIAQRNAYAEQQRSNQRLFERGEGTRTDVLETQAKFDLAEVQLLEARDNLQISRDALAAMVGHPVDRLDALSDNFKVRPLEPSGFEAWKNIALLNNPEIALQRHMVEIASEEVLKSKAGHLPRLDLVASVGKNEADTINTLNQSVHNRSVGLQLNIPLYAGGAVSAAITQAVANHDKARAELDGRISKVLVELQKQYQLILSSAARIDAATKALASALVLAEATQKSVRGGQRTNVDVLNAQQQVFDARREMALQRYNYLLAFLRLRYAAGTLTVTDLKVVASYFTAAR